jgi:hypothetical protein
MRGANYLLVVFGAITSPNLGPTRGSPAGIHEQISFNLTANRFNDYVWQRMVMFGAANVASPNFGAEIYDHLSPSTSSHLAAAAF